MSMHIQKGVVKMRVSISKFWKMITHIISLPIFAILYGIAWIFGFVVTMFRMITEENK